MFLLISRMPIFFVCAVSIVTGMAAEAEVSSLVIAPPSPASAHMSITNNHNDKNSNNTTCAHLCAVSVQKSMSCESVVTVAILLRSGVVGKSHSKVSASEDGET